jgi:DedD protein
MDSRLKERLVGAAVLVALGVWLIPWLLDGPEPDDRPAATDRTGEVNLPAADDAGTAAIRTETIDLSAGTRDEHSTRDAAPAAGRAHGSEAGAPRSASDDKVAATDPAPAEATSPRASTSSQTSRATARASAPAADAGADTAAASEAAGWLVQLGSFGDASNAERLSDRVDDYGYTAAVTTYRSGGTTLHRVRVGPWPSRDDAEAAASSLVAHGFVAQVVSAD